MPSLLLFTLTTVILSSLSLPVFADLDLLDKLHLLAVILVASGTVIAFIGIYLVRTDRYFTILWRRLVPFLGIGIMVFAFILLVTSSYIVTPVASMLLPIIPFVVFSVLTL